MSSETTMSKPNCSKIIGIQFSLLSPDEIRKGSVAEITSKITYVGNSPVIGGLFDPRMGVLEAGLICPTDGLDYMKTPGYFGHIELARPVYYIQYLSTSFFTNPQSSAPISNIHEVISHMMRGIMVSVTTPAVIDLNTGLTVAPATTTQVLRTLGQQFVSYIDKNKYK